MSNTTKSNYSNSYIAKQFFQRFAIGDEIKFYRILEIKREIENCTHPLYEYFLDHNNSLNGLEISKIPSTRIKNIERILKQI